MSQQQSTSDDTDWQQHLAAAQKCITTAMQSIPESAHRSFPGAGVSDHPDPGIRRVLRQIRRECSRAIGECYGLYRGTFAHDHYLAVSALQHNTYPVHWRCDGIALSPLPQRLILTHFFLKLARASLKESHRLLSQTDAFDMLNRGIPGHKNGVVAVKISRTFVRLTFSAGTLTNVIRSACGPYSWKEARRMFAISMTTYMANENVRQAATRDRILQRLRVGMTSK